MPSAAIQKIRDRLEHGELKLADLTARQSQVLRYILQCWMSGFIPTVREIGAELEIGSPNAVMCHLRVLRLKGYLEELEAGKGLMLADRALDLLIK